MSTMRNLNLPLRILMALMLLWSMVACSKLKELNMENYQTEKFNYEISAAQALNTEMIFVTGYCTIEDAQGEYLDNFGFGMANGVSDYYWGKGISLSGHVVRPLPARLKIRWFSPFENTFWDGEFDLPQEKIYALLSQQYGEAPNVVGRSSTSELTVNIAPQGMVVVWAQNFPQIEIGRFQAHKMEMDWADVIRSDGKLVVGETRELAIQYAFDATSDEMRRQIKLGVPLTSSKWDNFRVKYPYQVVTSPNITMIKYWGEFVNGEKFMASDLAQAATLDKPVPHSIFIWYDNEKGEKKRVMVKFKHEEIIGMFMKMFNQHQIKGDTTRAQLYFDLDFKRSQIHVSLRRGKEVLLLKNVDATIESGETRVLSE